MKLHLISLNSREVISFSLLFLKKLDEIFSSDNLNITVEVEIFPNPL